MRQIEMTGPRRVQRKRSRGWRMPDGCVYVGRPTRWGNPFTPDCYSPLLQDDGRWRDMAIADFRSLLVSGRSDKITVSDVRRELRGKSLACFCPLDKPCHADVLLEIANEEREPSRRGGKSESAEAPGREGK